MTDASGPTDAVQAVYEFLGTIIMRAEGYDFAHPATLRAINDIAWLRGVLHRSLTLDSWAVTASVITAGPERQEPTSSTT